MAKPKVTSVSISRSGTQVLATWAKSGTVTGYHYVLRVSNDGFKTHKDYSSGDFPKDQTAASLASPPAEFASVRLRVAPKWTTTSGTGKNKKTTAHTGDYAKSNILENPAYMAAIEQAAAAAAADAAAAEDAARQAAEAEAQRRAAPPAPPTPSVAFVPGSTSDAYVSGFGVSTSVAAEVFLYESVDGGAEHLVGSYPPDTSSITRQGIAAGSYVKYRAAALNTYSGAWSGSSQWSALFYTPPKAVGGLAAEATGGGTVRLSWARQTGYADATEVEWSPRADFLAGAEGGGSASLGTEAAYEAAVDTSVATRWYFRVRTAKSGMRSAWAVVGPVLVGTTPTAPTTYATAGSFSVDEEAELRWTHNCEDGCTPPASKVWVRVEHADSTWEDAAEIAKGKGALSHMLDLSALSDGDKVHWKVMTCSVVGTWSPYSAERVFAVYSQPVLTLSCTGGDGASALGAAGLTSLPLTIGMAVSNTAHRAVMYSAWITCENENAAPGADGVETSDAPGTTIWRADVTEGDDGWSGGEAEVSVGAGNRIVSDNTYTVHAVVAMSNGLRADAEATVMTSWDGSVPEPFMRFGEADGYAAVIYPVCEAVGEDGEAIPMLDGDGDPMYFGGNEDDPLNVLEEGVTLALYRIGADGRSELVEGGIANDGNAVVVDPHPTLNGCTYRLVATRDSTGATSYEEDNCYIECSSVLIQWDEPSERTEDGLSAFSMLELPYDISMTNDADFDVSFADYYGNEHPVARFGTQLGMTATWGASIVYDRDSEELRLARRLQVLQGTCHVREPSGTGYDAVVKVTETLKGAGKVALSFKVTRVMP